MGKYTNEVKLAGLLHDIGKFYQKAGRNKNIHGVNVSGHHAMVSAGFIECYRSQFAKYGINVDALKEMVQRHHTKSYDNNDMILVSKAKPEYKILCDIINHADNISSSERIEDTKLTGGYETKPIASIFTSWASKTGSIKKNHNYPIGSIETTFNKATDTHTKNDIAGNARWVELFANDVESKVFECGDFESMFDTMNTVLKHYLWCIPSDSMQSLPDVSLYDHLKTTSAIAAVMYDELTSNPVHQSGMRKEKSDIGWEFKASAVSDVDRFTLVCIKTDNTEEFILTNKSREVSGLKYIEKNRSFVTGILNDVVAEILDNGNLSIANVVIDQVYSKYILVNTLRLCEITEILNQFNKRLCVETEMALTLSMCSVNIPKSDMCAQEMYKYLRIIDNSNNIGISDLFHNKSGGWISNDELLVNSKSTNIVDTGLIKSYVDNFDKGNLALVKVKLTDIDEVFANMFKLSNTDTESGFIEYGTISRIATATRMFLVGLKQLELSSTITVYNSFDSIVFITQSDRIMNVLEDFKARIDAMTFGNVNVVVNFVTFNPNDELEYVHDRLYRSVDASNSKEKRSPIYYNNRPMRWSDIGEAKRLTESIKKSVNLNKSNLYKIREFIEGYYKSEYLGIARFFNKKQKKHFSPSDTDEYLVEFLTKEFTKFIDEKKPSHMIAIASEIIKDVLANNRD